MPVKTKFLLVAVAVLAFAGGIGIYYWQLQSRAAPASAGSAKQQINETNVIGTQRMAFSLKDTEGKLRDLTEWDGKVLIVNFWATWCPPCRREIPAFIELQEAYQDKGFSIIGVALDTEQAAVDFVDPMGINYPILVGEQEGIAISLKYGNRFGILPYTVVVDRNGIIRHAHRHELTFAEAEKLIKPLL